MNQGKTRKEWFELFPEPYRSEALYNNRYDDSKSIEKSAQNSLTSSFEWSRSKQGYGYWLDVYNKLESGEIELNDK